MSYEGWALAVLALPAAAVAWWVDRRSRAPGLAVPWRRAAAFGLLAALFYAGLFAPLAAPPSLAAEVDLSGLHPSRLFLLHGLLVAALAAWWLLAYGGTGAGGGIGLPPAAGAEGSGPAPPGAPDAPDAPDSAATDSGPPVRPAAAANGGPGSPAGAAAHPGPAGPASPERAAPSPIGGRGPAGPAADDFGLFTRRPGLELAVGVAAGLGAWAVVLAVVPLLAAAAQALGADVLVPDRPPAVISYLAAQPAWLRLAVSLSAGVVEETFFRGFLQPRLGLALTTVLFALAHAGYGQPLQLVAVAILSVIYGLLTRWRGDVWAAAAAHSLFDGIQLLVVIPWALELLPDAPFAP